MEFPRQLLLPRLESRCIIRQLWPGNTNTRKYLQLAKLDIQMLQKQYQQELTKLETWWMEQDFKEVQFHRSLIGKLLFLAAPTIFEPEFSAYRSGFVKICTHVTIFDNLADDKSYNLQELQQFVVAMRSWDPSLLVELPKHKLLLTSICTTVQEMAAEARSVQDHDLLPLYKDLWSRYVDAHRIEAEWMHSSYVPTFEEYIKVAYYTFASEVITLTTILLMGVKITDDIFRHIGVGSRSIYLVGYVARLANDIVGGEKELREGKTATALNCYLRDNPQFSREEAITAIKALIVSACQELEHELYLFRAAGVPECCSRAVLNFARTACLTYKIEDVYRNNVEEHLNLLEDFLFGSLE